MKVDNVSYRSVWRDGDSVGIIDQTLLPYEFRTLRLSTCDEVAHAITSMQVRGAPLIGAVAAYGLALALRRSSDNNALAVAMDVLIHTRPTAVNLRWALSRMHKHLSSMGAKERLDAAWEEAGRIADEDIMLNQAIGRCGLKLIRDMSRRKNDVVNVLTHCNAGWLATVDYGTALAPIYLAHDEGIPVHVWVDETRPRNQGFLTAWELGSHGVPYTVIADNAGGHLMQRGKVDLVLVGADRVTPRGDVCNKIGTYLKALAADANNVPFYAAVPTPTIDWTINDAFSEIPIEERSADELRLVQGRRLVQARSVSAELCRVSVGADDMNVSNPGFDVTPANLVTGIITELGVVAASEAGLASIYNRKPG